MVTGGVCGPAPRGPTGVAGGASVGLPPQIRDAVTGAWLAACAGPSPACPLAGFVSAATVTPTVPMVVLNVRSAGSGTWIGIATTGAGPCVASVGAGVVATETPTATTVTVPAAAIARLPGQRFDLAVATQRL